MNVKSNIQIRKMYYNIKVEERFKIELKDLKLSKKLSQKVFHSNIHLKYVENCNRKYSDVIVTNIK